MHIKCVIWSNKWSWYR